MALETDIDLIHIPDHGDQAVGQLPSRDRKPNTEALVRGLCAGVQLAEDLLWFMLNDGMLANATGAALDQWGELVGEQRLGLGDSDYRRFIEARMLVNRANPGTPNELIAIWKLITAPYVSVSYRSPGPCIIWLTTLRETPMTAAVASRVARMMQDAAPAGRLLRAIEAVVDPFGFEGDPEALGYNEGKLSRILE